MTNIVAWLRQLGLGEYEAKAYLALLRRPGSTGYEVAKRSGIPRAKVYEVLSGLSSKGVASASRQGERTLYHPVDPDDLLRRHLDRTQEAIAKLEPQLRQLTEGEPAAPLVTIRGYDNVLAQAEDVAAAAESRLFASGWPHELEALASALAGAEQRGVAVFVVAYGNVVLPIRRVFDHNPVEVEELDCEWDAVIPRLIMVADHAEVLIGHPSHHGDATALWTRNAAIATAAAEYVKHDVYLIEVDRLLVERGINLDGEFTHLQAMWFHDRLRSDQ